MKKRIIALMLVFLIFSTQFTYAQVTGTSDPEFINREQEEIPPGEDILINVAEYQPRVIDKGKFNTDDYSGYTVYALLTGMQTNPFIDISKISTITTRLHNTNIPGVQVAYKRPPLSYSLDNLGTILIRLPRIKDERKIPDRIDINMTATILYNIGTGFGVSEKGFNLPQISEQEFTSNKAAYSFWGGRGYIKADLVEDNRAVLTIYDGRMQRVRSGLTLISGQESEEISLSSGLFLQRYGENALQANIRDRFKVKLDYVAASKDKARLQILVNNKLILEELTENQRLYEGSSWRVKKITPTATQDTVELENIDPGSKETAFLTGIKEAVINCELIQDEFICISLSQCTYNTDTKKCLSASSQTSSNSFISPGVDVSVAEAETKTAIEEFNKLDTSSLFINYMNVMDKFNNLWKKYPNSVYSQLARRYITVEILEKAPTIELKKEVQDYESQIVKDNGLSINLAQGQTNVNEKSDYYYKKAIESYKKVVINENGNEIDKTLALDAQKKIAEIYHYYLNDADNAIASYQELIDSYEMTELEKINYESLIEILKTNKNYFTQPIDIFEDGNPVRVVLNGVERVDSKPVAFISLNSDVAREFKIGSPVIIAGDEKWVLENVETNKIVLVSSKTALLTERNYRQEVSLGGFANIAGTNLKLVKIDAKKVAHVTIKPVLKHLQSISNFQLHIPIDKTGIKLSDEQIDDLVSKMNSWISTLNSIIDRVEKIHEWWAKTCYIIASFLFLKNFVLGFGPEHFARQQVLKEWQVHCEEKGWTDSECSKFILENSNNFDSDSSEMGGRISEADKLFDQLKKAKIADNCDTLKNDLEKEYCESILLDSEKEVRNEDQIRAALLLREKSLMPWSQKEIKDKAVGTNLNKFFSEDLSLRANKKVETAKKELRDKFYDSNNKLKTWENLKKDLKKEELEELGSNGIDEKFWSDEKNNRQNVVDNFINIKSAEITQGEYGKLLNKAKYYEDILPGVDKKLITDELTKPPRLSLVKEDSDVKVSDHYSSVENIDIRPEPVSRYDIKMTKATEDWKLRGNPIYVATVINRNGKNVVQEPALTLRNYLKNNEEARKSLSNGDIKKLKLPEGTYLAVLQPDNKLKAIEIQDTLVQLPYQPEITIEENKLKTITVNSKYLLEVKRNSQGIITELSLWQRDYDGLGGLGYVSIFSVSKCREELKTYGTNDEISKACNDVQGADKKLSKQVPKDNILKLSLEYKIKGAILKTGGLQCFNAMSAGDCKWLFSACDPVMCPVSRFTNGGYKVENVVSSGIFGSIYLGLPLWNFDIPPGVGICYPAIISSLKNARALVQGMQQCLITKKQTGENVGICDTIFNIGICKLAWREVYTFTNLEGGLLGKFFRLFSKPGDYGGEEYAFFYENIKQTGEFVDFFVNEYATTFFAAYRGGSTKELGDTICEYAIYGKLPGGGDILDQLTRPEGPPKFFAVIDEAAHSNVGLQPTSDYSILYHLYAGDSYPEIKYYIYLKDSDEKLFPRTVPVAPRIGFSGGTTGYLKRGDFVTDTVRLSDLPTGYDEICFRIVAGSVIEKCGFGKVSSDFALEFLEQEALKDQLKNREITSERECVPDSTLTSQFASGSALQIATGISGVVLGSGLTQTGIIRKCSVDDPDKGTSLNRWEPAGTCGKDSQERSLGTCWVDMNSLDRLTEENRKKIQRETEDTTKLKEVLKELEESKDKYLTKIKSESSIIIKGLVSSDEAVKKEAKDKFDALVREGIRLADKYLGKELLSKTLDQEITQKGFFSVGEIYENIGHLLRNKEAAEKQLEIAKTTQKVSVIPKEENLCVIEYEENERVEGTFIDDRSPNFYYRFNNGKWELNTQVNKNTENKWMKVENDNCNTINGFFETNVEFNPIYKNICGGLKLATDFNQGMLTLARYSNGPNDQDDDYLIVHSKNNLRHQFDHGDSLAEIQNLCDDKKITDKKKVTILSKNNEGINYLQFIWDGIKWEDYINKQKTKGMQTLGRTGYEDGLFYIAQKALAEDLQKRFIELKMFCDDEEYVLAKSSEELNKLNIENEIDKNIKNDCSDLKIKELVKEKKNLFVVTLKFGKEFSADLIGDKTYSWNGNEWLKKSNGIGLQLSWPPIFYYSDTKISSYLKGFDQMKDDINSNKDNFDKVVIQCKTTSKSPEPISYFDGIIQRIKTLIETNCGYKGPEEAITPQKISQAQIDKLDTYNDYISKARDIALREYGEDVDVILIKAIIMQESSCCGFENAVSYCGAAGLMQLIPKTAETLGLKNTNYSESRPENKLENSCGNKDESGNIPLCRAGKELNCRKDRNKPNFDERFDPELNIKTGTLNLAWLLNHYKSYNNKETKEKLAIAGYNAGPKSVDQNCKKDEIFEECKDKLPDQTQKYVPGVLGYKEYLKNLQSTTAVSTTSTQNTITSNAIKILFVPIFNSENSPTYTEYDQAINRQYNFFISSLPGTCNLQSKFQITKLNSFNNFQKTYLCPTNAIVVYDLAKDYGYNPEDYNIIVGVGSEAESGVTGLACMLSETRNKNGLLKGFIWFKTNSGIDKTFAHEMGHLIGFDEQYCSRELGDARESCNSASSINPLSASLGCDISATGSNACCGSDVGLTNSECLGNKNIYGGRSIMSFADINDLGTVYWDQNELNHIKNIFNC